MTDNKTSTSKARPSVKTEDSSSFISETNTSVKAEHISSASIPTTPVSPSFKLQMCEINLSEYQSDGTYQKPVQIQLQYRSNDTILLNELTCEFNRGHHVAALGTHLLNFESTFPSSKAYVQFAGFWAKCIGGPPNGYALYGTLIYGHPKGPIESYKDLAEHVVSIIKGDIANCACALCTGPSRILEVSGETSGQDEQ
ncbi:unnamed protein product [Aureobasidium pullulans]|nr:hypothetical protein D6D29_05200 [Aureobasidium pullulans]CAD0020419.1 unnamed protein product [Aureobasidium pullulans]CAD0055438.1 unnamed protein product [Aureobasidium pullulans]